MKRLFTILCALAVVGVSQGWERSIHTGIAAIADANLTPTAREVVLKAFDGNSLAMNATYIYDNPHNEAFGDSKLWLTVAVNEKNQLIPAKKAAKSKDAALNNAQAFEALAASVRALSKYNTLSKQDLANHIYRVVTILTDLHCPSHYLYTDMKAERDWKYNLNKKDWAYSKFWEKEAHSGSYHWFTAEFVHQLNRKPADEVKALTSGTLTSWVEGNAKTYRWIYTLITPNEVFKNDKAWRKWKNKSYDFTNEQIAVAGYRIAALLNSLFDAEVDNIDIK